MCVLILLYMCLHTAIYVSSYYYVCHTTMYVSSYYYMCPHTTICVLILQCMCPHTTICVLMLLCICRHSTICVSTGLHLSSYYGMCVLILLCVSHTTIYVSWCYSVCVLVQVQRVVRSAFAERYSVLLYWYKSTSTDVEGAASTVVTIAHRLLLSLLALLVQ
jgi:hypothetical protein